MIDFDDIVFLSPLIILLIGALVLLLQISFYPSKITSFLLTLLTFFLSFILLNSSITTDNALLTAWLKNDRLSLIFTNIFLIIGAVSACFANCFFNKFDSESCGEYYFLLIASVFGLILIGAAADFLTLFLGLETLSIALYVLCGYMKKWTISHEASIKYFLMGSLGTAFLLYGIALIYGAAHTTNFDKLLSAYQNSRESILFFGGIALVTLGLLFKATVVPFHGFAPDVYEGATTPVTAFMAVGTKIGAFAALIRIFLEALPHVNTIWNESMALLFFPTVIYANIVAIRQTNLRRFFAYSGISHAGYLLIPFAAGLKTGIPSILFYLVVYGIATLGAFAVLTILDKEKRGLYLDDLNGLFSKSPFLATLLILALLTLAGIPPTVGFFAKFYIFKIGFQAGYIGLVAVGLIMTIFSAYYYLRIISRMLMKEEDSSKTDIFKSEIVFCLGAVSFVLMILFSVAPDLLLKLLEFTK